MRQVCGVVDLVACLSFCEQISAGGDREKMYTYWYWHLKNIPC